MRTKEQIEHPIWGLDVSNHQGFMNYKRLYGEGFRFVIAKASQGTYFKDRWFGSNMRRASNQKFVVGGYHWLDHGAINKQLDNFLSQMGGKKGCEGKIVAVDVERTYGYGGSATVNDVWNFIYGLRNRIGPHPIVLYSGGYWLHELRDKWGRVNPKLVDLVRDCDVHLWLAHYPDNIPGFASVIYERAPKRGFLSGAFGGQKADFLQFTQKARVLQSRFSKGKLVDGDAFAGSMGELRALGGEDYKPAPPVDRGFDELVNDSWWLVPSYGGEKCHTSTEYNQKVGWPKGYPFGCPPGKNRRGYAIGDSRHHGIDIDSGTGAPIHAWGRGRVRYNAYEKDGYHRFIGLYYPDADMSVDMGHLLNGSVQVGVGKHFEAGDVLAKIGTRADGITHSHVHKRVGHGDYGSHSIPACKDVDPLILWKKLGLPA